MMLPQQISEGTTCPPGEGTARVCAASHLPSARFIPASDALRGSAVPLPARRRFCFKLQSASSAAAAEPEGDEPEAAQRSCSKVTGSVRFLIPRPCWPAALGALVSPARLRCPRRSRRRSQPSPPGAGNPLPVTSQPQAAAPAMDRLRRPVGHRGQSAHEPQKPRPRHTPQHLCSTSSAPSIPSANNSHLGEGRNKQKLRVIFRAGLIRRVLAAFYETD